MTACSNNPITYSPEELASRQELFKSGVLTKAELNLTAISTAIFREHGDIPDATAHRLFTSADLQIYWIEKPQTIRVLHVNKTDFAIVKKPELHWKTSRSPTYMEILPFEQGTGHAFFARSVRDGAICVYRYANKTTTQMNCEDGLLLAASHFGDRTLVGDQIWDCKTNSVIAHAKTPDDFSRIGQLFSKDGTVLLMKCRDAKTGHLQWGCYQEGLEWSFRFFPPRGKFSSTAAITAAGDIAALPFQYEIHLVAVSSLTTLRTFRLAVATRTLRFKDDDLTLLSEPYGIDEDTTEISFRCKAAETEESDAEESGADADAEESD